MATVVREQTVPHVFVGRCRLSKAEVKAQGNNGVVAGVHLDNDIPPVRPRFLQVRSVDI